MITGRYFDSSPRTQRLVEQLLSQHDVDIKRLMKMLDRLGSMMGYPPGSENSAGLSFEQPQLVSLGKTDEAITGKSATTGTVSLYEGTPSSNSDTGENVECESWVDIDSGLYVNVIYRDGGYEAYPLECNA